MSGSEDDSDGREDWEEGTRVTVYSKGIQKWCRGAIKRVKGDDLTVQYNAGGETLEKEVRRDDVDAVRADAPSGGSEYNDGGGGCERKSDEHYSSHNRTEDERQFPPDERLTGSNLQHSRQPAVQGISPTDLKVLISSELQRLGYSSSSKKQQGDNVVVIEEFVSDSKPKTRIPTSAAGCIQRVSSDRWALVVFEGFDSAKWVAPYNFKRLRPETMAECSRRLRAAQQTIERRTDDLAKDIENHVKDADTEKTRQLRQQVADLTRELDGRKSAEEGLRRKDTEIDQLRERAGKIEQDNAVIQATSKQQETQQAQSVSTIRDEIKRVQTAVERQADEHRRALDRKQDASASNSEISTLKRELTAKDREVAELRQSLETATARIEDVYKELEGRLEQKENSGKVIYAKWDSTTWSSNYITWNVIKKAPDTQFFALASCNQWLEFKKAGVYEVTCQATHTYTSHGQLEMKNKSGTTIRRSYSSSAGGHYKTCRITEIIEVDTSDKFRFYLTASFHADQVSNFLQVRKLA